MIHITASLSDGHMELKAAGHANYAEHGKDVVCAAVSSIMQTALLGLQAIAEQYPRHVAIEIVEGGERANERV